MCTIDDILKHLNTNRQNITTQMDLLSGILQKSNSILLQLETDRIKKTSTTVETSNMKPYSFSKETVQTLSKAIDLYQQIKEKSDHTIRESNEDLGFSTYLHEHSEKVHYLSNNVRKLLVIGNVMSKVIENTAQNEISIDDQF